MNERLGGEDLPDRRGERRRADLGPDPRQLVEHVDDAIPGGVRAQVEIEGRDEAWREAVLGGERRDPWRRRRHGLVADELVDEVGGAPDRVRVDAGVEAEAAESGRGRLTGDAVQRQRERIDGAGDEVGAGTRRLDRRRERGASGPLAVEADG